MSETARHRVPRRGRAALVGAAVVGLGAAGLVGGPALAIDSNPPTGPGNIEIFPKRDMVAIEGYSEYAGKTATIQVIRDGQVVGSTKGVVDATGFLEVNHPGGACWGDGTNLKVTPDIVGGDQVRVDFEDTGGKWDGAVTSSARITGVTTDEATHSLTISGTYDPDDPWIDTPGADTVLDPGRMVVEIVNPEMRDPSSGIGERAIGWPTDEVPAGYSVAGRASDGTFEVTWTFRDGADLELAHAGEAVVVAWQADLPPELGLEGQLGNTLYEYYEASGPGFGGCPAGPEGMTADSPDEVTGKGGGPGALEVTWDEAVVAPGAAAVDQYRVRAVDAAGNEVGKRVAPTARSARIEGLTADAPYTVEITAVNANGESWTPATLPRLYASDHVVPEATATTLRKANADGKYAPLVTTANGDFGVFLDPVAGVLGGGEIYYTLDGSTPVVGENKFTPGVSTSLQIRQDTTVRWVVVDGGNVVGPMGSQFFDIVETTQPAPEFTSVVTAPASGAVDVSFSRLADETVSAYRVQAYTGSSTDVATGVRVGDPVNVALPTDPAATEVTRRITGLENGKSYRFSVAARYGTVWSNESPLSVEATALAAAAANAGPDQSVLRGRTVTLDGSASARVTGYQWTQIRPLSGTYRDPLLTLTGADTAKPTFRFPVKTSLTSDDGAYQFRLTTTHANADGSTFTRSDLVDIKEQRDAVAATEARWRAGQPIRMSGTGSQENAVLTFHDVRADGTTGNQLGTAVVTNGAWTFPAVNLTLTTGRIFVWSDYGYQGTITTTR